MKVILILSETLIINVISIFIKENTEFRYIVQWKKYNKKGAYILLPLVKYVWHFLKFRVCVSKNNNVWWRINEMRLTKMDCNIGDYFDFFNENADYAKEFSGDFDVCEAVN